MATFESISSTNFPTSPATSVVITKPTGLAVGDLMVAILAKSDDINAGSSDIETASGWTYRGEEKFQSDEAELNVQTKVADSSDVAASNFTFTADEPCLLGGAILRISNFGRFDVIEFDESGGTTTISYTATATPLRPDSLIITAFANTGAATEAASAYTSTPSITFTERLDQQNTAADDDPHLAIATGNYSGTSQITAYGCTLTTASNDAGCIIIINPAESPTIDVSHISVTPTIEGITASNNVSADVSHNAITPTINGIETSNSSDRTQWTPNNKNSTTWTPNSK